MLNEKQQSIIKKTITAMEAARAENIIMHTYHRGTAHCIGGYMEIANEMTLPAIISELSKEVNDWSDPIQDLFYMWGHSLTMFEELPAETRKAHSLRALHNFLEHGKPKWEEILDNTCGGTGKP